MRKQELHPLTATINKLQKSQSKKYRNDALLWLAKTFPQAFDNNVSIHPLKLGIMKDILNYAEMAAKEGISKSKLREAVVIYTRRIDYLTCLKARNMRIDLQGQPINEVTEEDAQRAALKIKKRIEKSIKNTKPKTTERSMPKGKPFYNGEELLPYTDRTVENRARTVPIKHKSSRQPDPLAITRLKEKLGLSKR